MSQKIGLCIGINDYPGTHNDLAGCVNDSNDWAAALKARGFTVQKLLDKQATKKNIADAMRAAVAQASPGDSVVIQYSGHGSYVPDDNAEANEDGTDEVLCPWDLDGDRNRYLTDDEINDIFQSRHRGVRILLISDSCHSGTVSKFAPRPPGTGKETPKARFLPPQNFLGKKALARLGQRRSRTASKTIGRFASLLMSGCQDVQVSYDAWFNGRPNGAFSFAALTALKKLSANATYRRWFAEIRKVLPSQQYPQAPNLYGSSSQKAWKVL
jgi:metacaspase-1